jgi:hypothetical protein
MMIDTNIRSEAPGYYVTEEYSIRRAAAYILGSMRAADLYEEWWLVSGEGDHRRDEQTMAARQGSQVLWEVLQDANTTTLSSTGSLQDLATQETPLGDFINALAAVAAHALRELEPQAEEREAWLRSVILLHTGPDDPPPGVPFQNTQVQINENGQ